MCGERFGCPTLGRPILEQSDERGCAEDTPALESAWNRTGVNSAAGFLRMGTSPPILLPHLTVDASRWRQVQPIDQMKTSVGHEVDCDENLVEDHSVEKQMTLLMDDFQQLQLDTSHDRDDLSQYELCCVVVMYTYCIEAPSKLWNDVPWIFQILHICNCIVVV